mgnify:FL=1
MQAAERVPRGIPVHASNVALERDEYLEPEGDAGVEADDQEEVGADMVLTEAEGLRLHLSPHSNTGYLGVFRRPNCHNDPSGQPWDKPFQAGYTRVLEPGRDVSLGCFATAVEAAVAYARHIARESEGQLGLTLAGKAEGAGHDDEQEAQSEQGTAKDAAGRVPRGIPFNASNVALERDESLEPEGDAGVEADDQEEVGGDMVTEAEGLRLHLSPRSNTGYRSVRREPNYPSGQPRAKPFRAEYRHDGRSVSLGYFATAVEAAVAYAKHMARDGEAAAEAEAGEADARAVMVTEAEGLRLHLSPRSSTGYLRVRREPNDPSGQPRAKPFRAEYRRDGRSVSLGCFATAIEAAVAYAKHMARDGEAAAEAEGAGHDDEQEAQSEQGTAKDAAGRVPRGIPFNASNVALERDESLEPEGDAGVEACDLAEVGADMVTEAEGLRLHLSPQSNTGYLHVIRLPNNPSGQPPAKPFQAKYKRDGRHVSLGCFTTAVEAAVAYARHIARDGEAAREADAAGMVTEAEGLRLHLSRNSSTGYRRVHRRPNNPSGQPRAKPFQVQYRRDGRNVSLGHFATAVEAAVAYAMHVAHDGEAAAEAEGVEHDDEQEAQSEQGAAKDAADQVPRGIPVHASNVAHECDECEDEDSDEDRDECGTFGCTLPDKHAGLHQIPTLVRGARERRPSSRVLEGLKPVSQVAIAKQRSRSRAAVGDGAWDGAWDEEGGAEEEGPLEEREEEEEDGVELTPDAAGMVTEAEGLRLHLSPLSNSGYLRVRRMPNYPSGQPRAKPFQVQYERDERLVSLGYFATAVEAAVAYARHMARDGESAGEADAAGMVTEAEGLRLHLSPRSNTGYRSVYRIPNYSSGQPPAKPFQARYKRDERLVSLGYFATAVEAAVAYAKHMARGGEAAAEAEGAGHVDECDENDESSDEQDEEDDEDDEDDEVGEPDGEVDDEDGEVKLELTPTEDEEEEEEDEECREVRAIPAVAQAMESDEDEDEALLEVQVEWEQLRLQCVLSHQRLIDPATLEGCMHLSRCNLTALEESRRHQSCQARSSVCPVHGCNISCLRRGSVRRDDWLRALLSTVPSTVDVIWLRGDEVSLTPPRREGGAMLSGNKGGKRKVEVALEVTATRPLQRRRRAMP